MRDRSSTRVLDTGYSPSQCPEPCSGNQSTNGFSKACPFRASFSSMPPVAFCRMAIRFLKSHTPESLRCIGSALSCDGFLTMGMEAGLEGSERRQAHSAASIVTHLAAAMALLEVGHAAHLGYVAHQRAVRAKRDQQQQRQSTDKAAKADASLAKPVASLLCTSADDSCSGRGPSASAVTSTIPANEGAPLVASTAPVAFRGQRLVSYWRLVETAINNGKRKLPSPSVKIETMLSRPAASAAGGPLSVSMTATTATGALNGASASCYSESSLLVLSEEFSFVVSPLARQLLTPSTHHDHPHRKDTTVAGCTSNGLATPDAPPSPQHQQQQQQQQPWLTLYLLWTDIVRYTVNTDEIRKLILSYPESFYNDVAQAAAKEAAGSPREVMIGTETKPSRTSGAKAPNGVETPCPHSGTSTMCAVALQEAAANLAIAWRLTLVRRVYDALTSHEDTQRCEDDVEELQTYSEEIHRRCIAPFQSASSGTSHLLASPASPAVPSKTTSSTPPSLLITCDPSRAWLQMSLALKQLKSLSHRLTIRSVGSLFRYMYASSKSKYVAGALLAVLTTLTSRVTSAGMRAREAVTQVLGCFYYRETKSSRTACGSVDGGPSLPSSSSSCGERATPDAASEFTTHLFSLCAFELIRLSVNAVLLTTSKQFISITASQRRDAMKAQLYEALTHLPLSFFDLHSYDEIEEIVYYVNDLEGVDVHVHQYAFTAITTLVAMRLALAPLSRQARLLVFGTVAASYSVQWIGAAVRKRYISLKQQQQTNSAAEVGVFRTVVRSLLGVASDPSLRTVSQDELEHQSSGGDVYASMLPAGEQRTDDAQVAENVSSANKRDGIMLRGLEIVAALPQLRPYGADVSLMTWWNNYVLRATYGSDCMNQGGVLSVFVRDARGHLAPALGNAALSFVDWFLPLFTSVYGAHLATRCQDTVPASASGRLLDATNAVKAGIEALFDARRVIAVALTNGYKAGVIERILSPRFWESTTSEDIDRVGAYASSHSWDNAVVRPPPVALYRRLSRQHADTLRAASAAAHSKRTYDHLMVTRLSVRNLQFSYPANPTVPVFTHPFSAELALQDAKTGRGRLVCLTGPSGQGKSTILHLLLGLYTNYKCVDSAADFVSPIELHLTYKGATPTLVDTSANSGGSGGATESSSSNSSGEEEYPVSLRDIPCSVLRGELFSYVPQYPSIFAGASIAHNITLAPYISLEETSLLAKAQACAEDARCDYIHRFPQGLLTPVGDASSLWSGSGPAGGTGFVRLSGGQAQRLMLARALYHGGSILLMDEPTASLDAATKVELLKEWRQLLDRGVIKGIICATHDETVIAVADEVLSLAQD